MRRSAEQLRRDALAIWQASVEAVRSDRLVREAVRVDGGRLFVCDDEFDLASVDRIVVVGAGKAGAGMAAGLEAALGLDVMDEHRVTGWINVPADCLRPTNRIYLHPARPPGVNEPTPEAVAGAERILEMVAGLGPGDLCLCLLSGGGSALLPAPAEGITLDDKLAVTRLLSGGGANIAELNTVRKQLSRIKGGGLLRASNAGRLVTLVISDVIGDPPDVIASGPTVPDSSTAAEALAVLERFHAREAGIAPRVFDHLAAWVSRKATEPSKSRASYHVIGNNAMAVDAAGLEAERRGYAYSMTAARSLEGAAEEVGRHLAAMALRMRDRPGPDCLITGGEPVVRLVPAERRGRGGRNQQLVLAALAALVDDGCRGIALASGGTDGEDGPTDAAGAVVDQALLEAAIGRGLDPLDYLARNDAYHFFEPLEGLIRTGPTHTNVCDVRVVVVDRIETAGRA